MYNNDFVTPTFNCPRNFGGFINTFKANLFFAQQDYL